MYNMTDSLGIHFHKPSKRWFNHFVPEVISITVFHCTDSILIYDGGDITIHFIMKMNIRSCIIVLHISPYQVIG